MNAPKYLTLAEASVISGKSVKELLALVDDGKLKAITIHGEIHVSANRLPQSKEQLAEFKKHKRLAGKPIAQTAAAEKYKLNMRTLTRWINKGWIAVIGQDEEDARRTMLNEQDVAYCAEVYHQRGGQGHWVFNDDGTPYVPKGADIEMAGA